MAEEATVLEGGRDGATAARRRGGWWSWVRELAIVLALTLIISALLRVFVGQLFGIPSPSMANTLQVDDRIFVRKVGPAPQRGDIVVFEDRAHWTTPTQPTTNPVRRVLEVVGFAPDSSKTYLVKRIIGMPGDKVVCCDAAGRVSVNGYALDETTYLFSDATGQDKPSKQQFTVVVPAGRVFVLGDHRGLSSDSRCHLTMGIDGFVQLDAIQGPVWAIPYPFNRAKTLERPATFDRVPAPAEPAPAEPTIIPADIHC